MEGGSYWLAGGNVFDSTGWGWLSAGLGFGGALLMSMVPGGAEADEALALGEEGAAAGDAADTAATAEREATAATKSDQTLAQKLEGTEARTSARQAYHERSDLLQKGSINEGATLEDSVTEDEAAQANKDGLVTSEYTDPLDEGDPPEGQTIPGKDSLGDRIRKIYGNAKEWTTRPTLRRVPGFFRRSYKPLADEDDMAETGVPGATKDVQYISKVKKNMYDTWKDAHDADKAVDEDTSLTGKTKRLRKAATAKAKAKARKAFMNATKNAENPNGVDPTTFKRMPGESKSGYVARFLGNKTTKAAAMRVAGAVGIGGQQITQEQAEKLAAKEGTAVAVKSLTNDKTGVLGRMTQQDEAEKRAEAKRESLANRQEQILEELARGGESSRVATSWQRYRDRGDPYG